MVAAGSGERFGGLKQMVDLGGRTPVEWSVKAAMSACGQVVAVLPAKVASAATEGPNSPGTQCTTVLKALGDLGATIVAGGATRLDSARAGLAALRPELEVVVVHDAVRPGATKEMFESVIGAVRRGADGAVPTLPVVDTIKQVEMHDGGNARVTGTLNRSNVMLAQTPQAFDRAALVAAHAFAAGANAGTDTEVDAVESERISAPFTNDASLVDDASFTDDVSLVDDASFTDDVSLVDDASFTDDASLVEANGGSVVAVPGDPAALKITIATDLVAVAALMRIDLSEGENARSPAVMSDRVTR